MYLKYQFGKIANWQVNKIANLIPGIPNLQFQIQNSPFFYLFPLKNFCNNSVLLSAITPFLISVLG